MSETKSSDAGSHKRVAGSPADGDYSLDLEQTALRFRAKAFCLTWVRGTLRPVSGLVTVAGDTVRGAGTADAGSVHTKLKPRDWHLRTSHYLHSAKHPEVRFSVEHGRLGSPEAEAQLEARKGTVTFPITIDEMQAEGDVLRIKASGSFDRRPLGMLPPLAGVSRLIDLELDIVARRSRA
jgi:polyisoprenoid-binding protein YceI